MWACQHGGRCTVSVWRAPLRVQSAVQAHEAAVQSAVFGVDFCCSRPLHSCCSCLDMHGNPLFIKDGLMQSMEQPYDRSEIEGTACQKLCNESCRPKSSTH